MSGYNINKREELSSSEVNKLKDFKSIEARLGKGAVKNNNFKFFKVGGAITFLAVFSLVGYFVFKGENKPNKMTELATIVEEITQPKIKPIIDRKEFREKIIIENINKGVNWLTKNNTLVAIKPSVLVDANGKEITGEVQLVIEEFNDGVDAVLAGIPMGYDYAGYNYQFRTGGMFDLKAYQDEKELFIKKGETVSVKMSTKQTGNDFNAYYFNDSTDKWEYKGDNIQEQRRIELAGKQEIANIKLPVVEKKKAIKLDFDIDEFPELKSFDNVLFYPLDGQNELLSELNKKEWEAIDLKKNDENYELVAYNRNENIKVSVIPSVTYDELIIQSKKIKDDNKKSNIKKITFGSLTTPNRGAITTYAQIGYLSEEGDVVMWEELSFGPQYVYSPSKQAIANSEIVNVFQISNFGMWNCDAPKKLPQGMLADNVAFVDSLTGDTIDYKGSRYLSENDKQLMFTYYNDAKFSYNPKSDNLIWFVHLVDKKPHLFYVKKRIFNKHVNHYFKMSKYEIDTDKINRDEIKKVLGLS